MVYNLFGLELELLLPQTSEMLLIDIHACDFARFKCSANVIVPEHATISIGVSNGSTFVVIGRPTVN
jgi:hypothetical protein